MPMKIIIAGDFAPHARGQEMLNSKEYIGYFDEVRNILSSSDYAIVNFETNVSTSSSRPIKKNGPNLTTTPEAIEFIKYLGFKVVTLANNHFYDYGDDAVRNTLALLDNAQIGHVGGGENIYEASKILFLEKNRETVAIINACEHEFSIADESRGGSYGIDPVKIYHDIKLAKEKADYVLVIIHGGHEHYALPSLRMQDWYRFFIESGADAVVNHHQHCFSGMEIYRGKPIYYGIGNFFFDDKNQKNITSWNKGVLIRLEFYKDKIISSTIPYIQCAQAPSINMLRDTVNFNMEFDKLSSIIVNRNELLKHFQQYCINSKKYIFGIFEPYIGRILESAYSRGLLPSYLTTRKRLSIFNMIQCEAHLDKLRMTLKNSLK